MNHIYENIKKRLPYESHFIFSYKDMVKPFQNISYILIMKPYFMFAILFFGAVFGQPISINSDLIEGDMILTPDQRNILYNENGSKNGLINPALRWPKAVVFYKFATSIRK